MCTCKGTRQTHDELADLQSRLDARGNDPRATRRESDFAVDIWKNLNGTQMGLLYDHFEHLAGQVGGRKFKAAVEGLTLPIRDPMKLAELMFDKSNGFKGMLDNQVNAIKRVDPYKAMHESCRAKPFFAKRGRSDVGGRVRQSEYQTAHGGITTSRDRSDDSEDVFTKQLGHAQGVVIQVRDETRQLFSEQGAPFIGGASGTIEYLCLSLEGDKPRRDLSTKELAARETLLALHMTSLVVGGHHSMTETLVSAKAMGYFADVPDPLTDYDAAMKGLEDHLAKLHITTEKPLSRESEDTGKSAAQIRYEAYRTDTVAYFEKFQDQLPTGTAGAVAMQLEHIENITVTELDSWDKGTGLLKTLKTQIDFEVQKVIATRTGHDKLFTGDKLVEKFGSAPSTKKARSKAYKETRQQLDAFDQSWKELQGRTLGNELAEQGLYDLEERLDAIIAGAQAYIDKHGTTTAKKARVAEMRALVASTQKEKGHIEDLKKNLDTWKASKPDLTFEQALQFARLDIDMATLADLDTLDPKKVTSSEVLGAGAVNTVYEVVYSDPPNPNEVRVLKPEPETEDLKKAARTIGIDGDKPGYGKRNIASRKTCEALGLGDMISPCDFTLHDGKPALAMGKAPGKTLYTKDWWPVPEYNLKKTPEKNLEAGYRLNKATQVWESKVRFAADLPYDTPPEAAAKMQQQLMNLQWLDGFCGQADRHAENYLVDYDAHSGRVVVTGIDNDFSFGENHKSVDKATIMGRESEVEVDITKGTYIGEGFCGKPPLIDKTTYDHIVGLDWAVYALSIGGLLTAKEIAATKTRFEDLKAHAQSLNPAYVVTDWLTWRSPDGPPKTATEFLMSHEGRNYYSRDTEFLQGKRASQQVKPG